MPSYGLRCPTRSDSNWSRSTLPHSCACRSHRHQEVIATKKRAHGSLFCSVCLSGMGRPTPALPHVNVLLYHCITALLSYCITVAVWCVASQRTSAMSWCTGQCGCAFSSTHIDRFVSSFSAAMSIVGRPYCLATACLWCVCARARVGYVCVRVGCVCVCVGGGVGVRVCVGSRRRSGACSRRESRVRDRRDRRKCWRSVAAGCGGAGQAAHRSQTRTTLRRACS